MMNVNIGTARTNAANSRCSCATDQIAARLPTIGKARYCASTYGVALALTSAAACSAARPCARGVESTAASGARYASLYSLRLSRSDAIHIAPTNIRIPATGPRRISTLRLIAPFSTPFVTVPSSVLHGRARSARQPLAFELPHVGDDRPPVRRRDRPAVSSHQPLAVRDHVEDLPVRVLEDLLLVEGGG